MMGEDACRAARRRDTIGLSLDSSLSMRGPCRQTAAFPGAARSKSSISNICRGLYTDSRCAFLNSFPRMKNAITKKIAIAPTPPTTIPTKGPVLMLVCFSVSRGTRDGNEKT
jgi:hypothetical protein